MGQTLREFWAEVRHNKAIILAACEKQAGQPKVTVERDQYTMKDEYHGDVYLTSVRNRDRNTEEGSIVIAQVNLAAQRIAEGTHRLSTDAEIEAFQAEHARRKDSALQAEVKKQTMYTSSVEAALRQAAAVPAGAGRSK
jgi:hypothetical protein